MEIMFGQIKGTIRMLVQLPHQPLLRPQRQPQSLLPQPVNAVVDYAMGRGSVTSATAGDW